MGGPRLLGKLTDKFFSFPLFVNYSQVSFIWRGTEGTRLLSDMLCVFAVAIVTHNVPLYCIILCLLSFFVCYFYGLGLVLPK